MSLFVRDIKLNGVSVKYSQLGFHETDLNELGIDFLNNPFIEIQDIQTYSCYTGCTSRYVSHYVGLLALSAR